MPGVLGQPGQWGVRKAKGGGSRRRERQKVLDAKGKTHKLSAF